MSSNQTQQQQQEGLSRRISLAVLNTQVVRTVLSNNIQKPPNGALIRRESNLSNNPSSKVHSGIARSSSTSSLAKQVGSNRFFIPPKK